LEGEIEKRHIYSIKNESSKPMSTCYICGLGHEIKIILWKANKKNYETQLKKNKKINIVNLSQLVKLMTLVMRSG